MPDAKTILERSPFYAFIGAADAAVESFRTSFDSATETAQSLRGELTTENVQERILNTVNDVRDQIFALPSLATERYELVAGNVERAYDEFAQGYLEFAQRGLDVTREATEQGLALVASTRQSVTDTVSETGNDAVVRVLGARKEAAKGVERLAGLVGRNADAVEAEAETVVRSTAAKQGAAKRPTRSSVAKKAGARKTAAKKPAAKKAPAKKAAAKKAPAKKATPAKTAAVPTLPVEAKVEAKVDSTDNA